MDKLDRLCVVLMFGGVAMLSIVCSIKISNIEEKLKQIQRPSVNFCIYELGKDKRGVNFKIDSCMGVVE